MKPHPLRVLVDARMMIGRFSGVARYVTRLIDESVSQGGIEVIALCAAGGADAWLDRNDVETIISSFSRADRPASRRVEWDALYLRQLVRDSGADIFHATWNTGIPALCPVPSVLTIHDLIPWRDPDAHFATRWQKTCYRYAQRASARRAAKIITVSDFVRREVIRELGVGPAKVQAVRNGVDLPVTSELSGAVVPNRYLLYVGGKEPRKNLASLFTAIQKYWEHHADRVLLHLTGTAEGLDPQAQRAFSKLSYKDRVRFLGLVDDAELQRQYASAQALITLSLDEGFGLPVLEAMAHGCPVIAARRAALPEVVGQAGVLVNPDDLHEVVGAINRIMTDADYRRDLIDRGRRQAERYTWHRTAEGVRSVYEEVASAGEVHHTQQPELAASC